jgi:AcrR family transcriptional regulator
VASSLVRDARRSDALRNRARILVVAKGLFGEAGLDVSMAEVARRAQVGNATLHRNFPSKRALLEALFSDEIDALCAAADEAGSGTAAERLLAWLRQLFTFLRGKRRIAARLLELTEESDHVLDDGRSRVLAAGQPLLAAAQHSGEVRGDVNIEQVADLVHAIATIPRDDQYVAPILRAALDGLNA